MIEKLKAATLAVCHTISDAIAVFLYKTSSTQTINLILKPDAIGDYILFRNLFYEIKNAPLFKDKKLILCGNIAWKNLTETFDSTVFDELIWIDRKKAKYNLLYRIKLIGKLRKTGCHTALYAVMSREYAFDKLIKSSGAKIKIACKGDLSNISEKKKNKSDKYYDKLIETEENSCFEFFRNKKFVENLVGQKINIRKPYLATKNVLDRIQKPEKPFIVLFPGASTDLKRWSTDNFAATAEYLLEKYHYDLLIAGGPSDYTYANKITQQINSERVNNRVGETTLAQLASILTQAALLISNDTGAIHIAAAVDIPVICVTNGNRFGRFVPYPIDINDKMEVATPDTTEFEGKSYEELSEEYKNKYKELDINKVSIESVLKLVKKALK